MKKISILSTIVFLIVCSSCSDFLDRTPLSDASEEVFWKTTKDAEAGVNALYPLLPGERDFWRDCQSDNSVMTNAWGEGGLGYICQGTYNAATTYLREEWSYISKDGKSNDLERILYYIDKLKGMEIDAVKKKQFEGEARFILALKYFRLTRHFGDVPLIKEKPLPLAESTIPRSPKQEVLDYALENVNIAINNLPEKYDDPVNNGRITKAAALMLKADIYLDMASWKKFHNSQNDNTLWKNAADAAQEVINLGLYELESDFNYIFTYQANNNNKEVILANQYKESERTHMIPVLASPSGIGVSGEGWASFCPTRDLVDSYECLDGKTIYESALYDVNNPWENRDIRLKKTFMLPGVDILRPNKTFSPYMPHPDYRLANGSMAPERMNNEGGGVTGFMYLKYNELTIPAPYDSWTNFSLYRYAETLLILAEALNEYQPGDNRIAWAVNKVRTRAGLPEIDNILSDQEKVRNVIREERRHEFVCEHKRYFDILRWKTAENVLNKSAYGINKDFSAPIGAYNIEQFLAQSRTFDPGKNYCWPIPQSALDNNSKLVQTTGW